MSDRLSKTRDLLRTQSMDAILVSSLPNIIYLTSFDYFTPLEREGFLLITKKQNYILTDGRYSHAVKTHIKNFILLEISSKNSLENLLTEIFKKENIRSVGIEPDDLSVSEYERIKKCTATLQTISLSSLRLIKEKSEIAYLKKACNIGDQAFSYILNYIKPGMTEKEIALEIEMFIRKMGWNISFDTIVAFAENAAVPHHKTSDRKLNKNDLILLDFGVKYENYCSDMTRTVFFKKASTENKKIYQTVLDAQTKAAEYIQSQLEKSEPVSGATADKTARDYILAQGYPTIPHSLGHGVGLEVHESPRLSPTSKDTLTNGMVFSIEPGIYLPDKTGVRIEDLYMIEDDKLVQLTQSLKQLCEV